MIDKIAYVFFVTTRGQLEFVKKGDNNVAFGIFKWFMAHRDGECWSYHLFAFCNGVTESFVHQSYQGIFVLGWKNGLYFEFSQGMTVHRLWLWPPRYEKGALS